jgi:hypothetical protein
MDAKRRKRRHSARQLIDRPITVPNCAGPIIIGAELVRGMPVVQISFPAVVSLEQPPATPAAAPSAAIPPAPPDAPETLPAPRPAASEPG